MTDLPALLAKVTALTGPDCELDRELGLTIGGWELRYVRGDEGLGQILYVPEDRMYYSQNPGGGYPALTGSIDAAVAFVERVLPEVSVELWIQARSQWDENERAGASLLFPAQPEKDVIANANTPPLAILAALLNALIEQEKASD